jgi:FkbM family methyltransferase
MVRNYLFKKARVGRSTFKKFLKPFLSHHQTVLLEPGFLMQLDLSKSNHEFLFWFYEEHEASLQWAIKTLLPEGGTFLDCGANLGLMGTLAIYHKNAHAIFIEPHPSLAKRLRNNLELNRFSSRATVCEVAASNKNGTAVLHLDDQSDGGHSLVWQHNTDHEIKVKTQKLEDLLVESSIGHIDFLKIDAEGHDLQVLQGLANFLTPSKIDLIYVEMGEDSEAIWKLLTNKGYRAFASDTIYIDRLRELQKNKDESQFFSPVEETGDGNIIWCAPNSEFERILLRACGSN